jgi:hypothetical protein
MLPLSFGAAAGGRWVLSALLKNHQRFALLTDLTCLVLADLFELLCCSCEIWVCLVLKIFHTKTSHRILRHVHGVLNVDETKKLIAQFTVKSRDESFSP